MKVLGCRLRPILVLCLLVLFPCVVPQASAAEASYLTVAVPGALGTFPMSINSSMTVAGYYTTSPTTASAFIRDAAGTITTFSIRGSLWTEPESINDSGEIAGFYEVVTGLPRGFMRDADGRIVTFNPPSNPSADESSQPIVINNFGEIAGNFPFPLAASAGFTRSRAGSFLRFDGPCGAAYPVGVLGLNSYGAVIGYGSCSSPYIDGSGFLSHPDGSAGSFGDPGGYTVGIEVPVSGSMSSEATIPEAVNDEGVVAGWYRILPPNGAAAAPKTGGFVRSPQGEFTTFNPPGTLVAPPLNDFFIPNATLSSAPKNLSLNASGTIAGAYTDATGTKHGFVRNPYGTITAFDPPRGTETTVTGMNNSGVITGSFFYDWNSQTSMGFLRIPPK